MSNNIKKRERSPYPGGRKAVTPEWFQKLFGRFCMLVVASFRSFRYSYLSKKQDKSKFIYAYPRKSLILLDFSLVLCSKTMMCVMSMEEYPISEAIVEQYNRELAGWERKATESRRPAEKERYAPPERKSIRDQLRRLQAESRHTKPKHRSHGRER